MIRDLSDVGLFEFARYDEPLNTAPLWMFELLERRRFYSTRFTGRRLDTPLANLLPAANDQRRERLMRHAERLSDVGRWVDGEFVFTGPVTSSSHFSEYEFVPSIERAPIQLATETSMARRHPMQVPLLIDFLASDAALREWFDQYLRASREKLREDGWDSAAVKASGTIESVGDDELMNWRQCGLLLYLDIMQWSAITNTKVMAAAIGEAIYGQESREVGGRKVAATTAVPGQLRTVERSST